MQSNSHPEKFNYFNIDTLEDQEDHGPLMPVGF
jgi:hypothetical protein